MTTVRHETVHYTGEEMAAKEATEKAAKAKKQKTTLIICGVVLLIAVICCCGPSLVGTLSSDTPKARTPEEVIGPTPFPTLACLTVARIEQERGALTDLQKEQYDQSILGEVIKFHGQISEVNEDGSVFIDEGGFFTMVRLLGIPKDEAIALHKGHLISGMGTVVDVDTLLLLTIEVQVTSWNN